METGFLKKPRKNGHRPNVRKWNNGVLLAALCRQLEHLFPSFCPCRMLFCLETALTHGNLNSDCFIENTISKNHIFPITCKSDPPVG